MATDPHTPVKYGSEAKKLMISLKLNRTNVLSQMVWERDY